MDMACEITRRRTMDAIPELPNLLGRYDALVANYKLEVPGGEIQRHELLKRLGSSSIPSILFINKAVANFVPEDDVLDRFDLVFKREHFRDLDRYPIANRNKAKLRATMLGLMPSALWLFDRHHNARRNLSGPAYRHDVYFNGSTSSAVRTDVWDTVVDSRLSSIGGLQLTRYRGDRERRHETKKFGFRRHLKTMSASRINLALEGWGEFTFRHLEIWGMGSFMVSTKSLRDLVLPLNVREGEHFVVFEDLDDLRDKLSHYAHNDTERERISEAGRAMFLRDYDLARHGEEIREAIQGCSA